MTDVIQTQKLYKSFVEGHMTVPVLQGINLNIATQQTLAILGSSGSGKSTLLHLLGGLDTPTSGHVFVQGQDFFKLNIKAQGLWRNQHLGFVYQFHHLLAEFNALENVAMPLLVRRIPNVEAKRYAQDMLTSVGLATRMLHSPAELSGGERQRVAIARALVTNPACILADEPTGNLDGHTAEIVFNLILDLVKEKGMSFVLVTHDKALANRCGRALYLENGQLMDADESQLK
jgi:lipoprotein-releasing system ATP-binding protein